MAVGTLTLVSQPLVLTIDSWDARSSNFDQFKPDEFARVARDTAVAAGNEAIAEIATKGDILGRLPVRGNPIAALAAQEATSHNVTSDDLRLRFLSPPSITWSGGGVAVEYKPVDIFV